jgi:hypothetical protein
MDLPPLISRTSPNQSESCKGVSVRNTLSAIAVKLLLALALLAGNTRDVMATKATAYPPLDLLENEAWSAPSGRPCNVIIASTHYTTVPVPEWNALVEISEQTEEEHKPKHIVDVSQGDKREEAWTARDCPRATGSGHDARREPKLYILFHSWRSSLI